MFAIPSCLFFDLQHLKMSDNECLNPQSFIIPVSVRVWDVNDNAPAWAGAPYRVRLSELTAVGARVLHPRASDLDQPGPHATITYSVLPGPHVSHYAFCDRAYYSYQVGRSYHFGDVSNTLRLLYLWSPLKTICNTRVMSLQLENVFFLI